MTSTVPAEPVTAPLREATPRSDAQRGLSIGREVGDGPEIETVVEPPGRWVGLDLPELWRYRDLLKLMIWRDITARYRQSVAGISWAVIKPVTSMLIFSFVFGRVAGIQSDGGPYPLFVFSALLPWMYFSGVLGAVTNSVVSSGALLKKVYFPRLILPLTGVVTCLVEFLIQLVVLLLIMVWYRHVPGWQILAAPLFVLVAAVTALSVGLWLTALNVKYRDIGQAYPFAIQAWMWLSPVVYSSSAIPEHLRMLYGLNPMVGVIEGFRWSFLGTTVPDFRLMTASFAVVVLLLVSGLYFFRRTETTFADVI
ncbi:MAG: ABC transporter permease [Maioricimonas sp. JB049]